MLDAVPSSSTFSSDRELELELGRDRGFGMASAFWRYLASMILYLHEDIATVSALLLFIPFPSALSNHVLQNISSRSHCEPGLWQGEETAEQACACELSTFS